ncbi:MAG: indole-3-glycerol phosphate synthase TrpC [Alphaproteobacteria bacterium]
MADILKEICDFKREQIKPLKEQYSEETLLEKIKATPAPRGFYLALEKAWEQGRYGLIAEIKKASPSKGLIREDFDVASLAKAYENGGATCLSVLTETRWFQGDPAYVKLAHKACNLPVLRKDFIVDVWQVLEARSLYADCILIIMAALEDSQVTEIETAAFELGMDTLIEVHDEKELERALKHTKSPLIGVNNRNLKTFDVNLEITEELARHIPEDRFLISESGIYTPYDLARLAKVGASHFLIGESLMRQDDVEQATKDLLIDSTEQSENLQSNIFRF